VNGFTHIRRTGVRPLPLLAIVLLTLMPAALQAAPSGGGDTRDIKFRILYQQSDGAWLVPTLQAVRSARQWESAMDDWQAKQQVVGREPAPSVDWSHDAVIVLALGTQIRQTAVKVLGCSRDTYLTMVDLHFELPGGGSGSWDPLGTVEHPCVVLAVPREDLKELRLLCDAKIDGLPMDLTRHDHPANGATRPNAAVGTTIAGTGSVASVPMGAGDGVLAGDPVRVSWGAIKARYHDAAQR
jgi:hypothetical protein